MYEYVYKISLPAVYREAGRFADALKVMDDALHIYHGDEPNRWQFQKGNLLIDIGKNDLALQLADEMKFERLSLRFKGKALANIGEYEKAEESAAKHKSLSGILFYQYMTKAYIAVAKKDADSALEYLKNVEAIAVPFGSMLGIQYWTLLAEAHRLNNDLDKAVLVHERLLHIYGGHALSHYELGKLYESLGRLEKAKANYIKFLEMWKNADKGLPQPEYARERLGALKGY